MKKSITLILCLIALSCNLTYAQINSIKAFDGKTYVAGDTIIGGKRGFHSYISIKELDNKTLLGCKTDIIHHKLVIQDWVRARDIDKIALDDTLTIVKNIQDGTTLYINLVDALRRNEIIAEPAVRLYPKAEEASIATIQEYCIKTNQLPITDYKVKYYIKAINPELGKKCQNDEFEYHAAKDEYQSKLEGAISNLDFSKIYYIDQGMAIGEYDFGKKSYPVKFINLGAKDFLKYGDFHLSIPNLSDYTSFMIPVDKAQRVNKLRYMFNSNAPSSLVYVRSYFRFLDQKMPIKKDKYEFGDPEKEYRESIVGIQLVGMEFYTESNVEYNYLGSIPF